MANSIAAGDKVGAVQKFINRTLFKEKDFLVPFTSGPYATKTTLPLHGGQMVEFRWFGDMGLPEEVSEGADPATGASAPSETLTRPIYEVAEWFELTNLLQATDWVSELPKLKEAMQTAFKRKAHRMFQDCMAKTISRTLYGQTFVNPPLPRAYACGKQSFGQITESDFFTLADIRRCVMMLRNSRVPTIDDKYVCVMSAGVEATLMDDVEFRDAVKRHESMVKESTIPFHIMDWAGVRFIRQTEAYKLEPGGDGVTRIEDGPVEIVHIFGKNAFGSLEMGAAEGQKTGGTMNSIKYKVQDISKTDCCPTVGARVAFATHTLQKEHGICLVGANKYSETNA